MVRLGLRLGLGLGFGPNPNPNLTLTLTLPKASKAADAARQNSDELAAELVGLRGKEAKLLAMTPLMPGWEEVDGGAEHGVYYYNSTSGETTYERPSMDTRKKVGKPSELQSVQETIAAYREAREYQKEMEADVQYKQETKQRAEEQLEYASKVAEQSASEANVAKARAAGD